MEARQTDNWSSLHFSFTSEYFPTEHVDTLFKSTKTGTKIPTPVTVYIKFSCRGVGCLCVKRIGGSPCDWATRPDVDRRVTAFFGVVVLSCVEDEVPICVNQFLNPLGT